MSQDFLLSKQTLDLARQALRQGNRRAARRYAEQAAALTPNQEEVWLWLASVASPRASVAYLNRALEINPHSQRARQGMHWAIKRLRASGNSSSKTRRIIVEPTIPSERLVNRRPALGNLPWVAAVLVFLAALVVWLGPSSFSYFGIVASAGDHPNPLIVALAKASLTPTPTATFTPTPTFTPSPTPTDTPTFTPSPTDTSTPLPTDTPEPPPADTPEPPPRAVDLPAGVGESDRWIDVNLSEQTTYAYEGYTLVNAFIVSTGTWEHPTVTGQYQIYVKYRYTDMAGPGYYLPNVPYTMYFYQGYALHGTYWHSNFGTPMSHGCINLTIDEAGWLFNWASVGTLVNIHY